MTSVALLTFQETLNFGALLQTYATYKFLKDNGYDCTILNYRNNHIYEREYGYRKIDLSKKDNIIKYLVFHRPQKKKYNDFWRFLKRNTKITKLLCREELETIGDIYDYYIAGSDMIWNLDITESDMSYFLDFVGDTKKKIAYAPSFGNIPNSRDLSSARMYLRQFSKIYLREDVSKDYLEDILDVKIDVVADPTMLISRTEWKEIALHSTMTIRKKYILIYFMDKNREMLKLGKRIAERNNLSIVLIHCGRPIRGVKCLWPTKPEDFLNLIDNAELVITSSYHGLLFSMYFNKAFYYYNTAYKERMNTIVKYFGLDPCEGRATLADLDLPHIDYGNINKKMDDLSKFSAQKLIEAILSE